MFKKNCPWLRQILVFCTAALLVACTSPQDTRTSSTEATTSPAAQLSVSSAQIPQLVGTATVLLQVNGKPIQIKADGTNAPLTAGNFVDLVQRGVYQGTTFHRVVREPEPFVVQGGDPLSKDPSTPAEQLGTGSFLEPTTSQPRYIPLEIKPEGTDKPIYHQTLRAAGVSRPPQLKHTRGAVAMARSTLPDSASSQFYITLADRSFLDGDYAVFGYVTDGMDVVDQIQPGDKIESAKVTEGLENLKSVEGSSRESPQPST